MTNGGEEPKSKWIPTSVRLPSSRRRTLQAVHDELKEQDPEAHRTLGDTIRYALDQFLERYFRREV